MNYDAGETVGWPRLAAAVEDVRADLPAGETVAVLTANYGEAGVDRFAPVLGPPSGHNAYGTWGPPPEDVDTVIVVGYPEERLAPWFGRVEPAAHVDNGVAWTTRSRAPDLGGHRPAGSLVGDLAELRRLGWSPDGGVDLLGLRGRPPAGAPPGGEHAADQHQRESERDAQGERLVEQQDAEQHRHRGIDEGDDQPAAGPPRG